MDPSTSVTSATDSLNTPGSPAQSASATYSAARSAGRSRGSRWGIWSIPSHWRRGEQQQIVLVDQQTSLRLADSQTIVAEQQADSTASSDSSTQSVFSSALNQFANGTSTQNATSTTTGGATSGGLVGLVLGGSSGSTGTTTTSGTNTSSMDGVQNYASNAAQSMQNNAAQQSMLARRGQSTSIRAASASETTSVTTKTITNHNKLHALTLQYFEAVRLYDISTAFESATLVALVPLDVVWFLPPASRSNCPISPGAADATSAVQIASTLANIAAAQLALLAQATAIAAAPFNIGLATVRQTGNSLATTAAAGGQLAAAAQNLNNLLSAAGSVMAGIANDIVTAQLPKIQAAVAQYNADTSNNPIALASELNQSVPGLTAIQQQATTIKQQLALPASNAMSRQHVLARYAGLLANSDVLQRSLPRRFRSGLTRLDRFAADPSATVALNSLAEDVIQISANASALPFDHVYVTVVTRWGSRLGPIEMLPSPPVTIPGQFDVNGRFKTTQDLLQYLQTQRNPGISSAPVLQASIALPRTLSPSDVMGFEITHTTDAFSYQLAAPSEIATSTLGSLFGTNGSAWPPAIQNLLGGLLTSTLPTPASPPAATFVTYTPNDIATRIGPPYMWNFAANLLAEYKATMNRMSARRVPRLSCRRMLIPFRGGSGAHSEELRPALDREHAAARAALPGRLFQGGLGIAQLRRARDAPGALPAELYGPLGLRGGCDCATVGLCGERSPRLLWELHVDALLRPTLRRRTFADHHGRHRGRLAALPPARGAQGSHTCRASDPGSVG